MPILRGFDAIAGIGSETTSAPNTEVAVTQKLRIISESWNPLYNPIEQEALVGSAGMARSEQGILTVGGQLVTDWTYTTGADLLLSKFFGLFTAQTSVADGFYTFLDNLDDITFTYSIHKLVSTWTYTGGKFGQLQIAGAPGQPMRLTQDGFGMGFSLASTTNTTAVLDALSEPDARLLFHHLCDAFLIGDQADSLTSDDNWKINNFQLTLNRNHTQFHTQCQNPEQSRENGFFSAQLQVTLPLYEDNQFRTWHASHTPLQMQATWTKAGTSNTRKRLRLPMGFVTDAPVPVNGPGLIPRTVNISFYHDLAGDNDTTEFNFSEVCRLYQNAT